MNACRSVFCRLNEHRDQDNRGQSDGKRRWNRPRLYALSRLHIRRLQGRDVDRGRSWSLVHGWWCRCSWDGGAARGNTRRVRRRSRVRGLEKEQSVQLVHHTIAGQDIALGNASSEGYASVALFQSVKARKVVFVERNIPDLIVQRRHRRADHSTEDAAIVQLAENVTLQHVLGNVVNFRLLAFPGWVGGVQRCQRQEFFHVFVEIDSVDIRDLRRKLWIFVGDIVHGLRHRLGQRNR